MLPGAAQFVSRAHLGHSFAAAQGELEVLRGAAVAAAAKASVPLPVSTSLGSSPVAARAPAAEASSPEQVLLRDGAQTSSASMTALQVHAWAFCMTPSSHEFVSGLR